MDAPRRHPLRAPTATPVRGSRAHLHGASARPLLAGRGAAPRPPPAPNARSSGGGYSPVAEAVLHLHARGAGLPRPRPHRSQAFPPGQLQPPGRHPARVIGAPTVRVLRRQGPEGQARALRELELRRPRGNRRSAQVSWGARSVQPAHRIAHAP